MRIKLHRAEGPSEECVEKTFNSFADANNQLALWGVTAPKGGGYDKVDFTVDFGITDENGEPVEYSGRFDMVYGGSNDSGENLQGQIKNYLSFLGGLSTSNWMIDKYGLNYYKEKYNSEEARQFLRTVEGYLWDC